MAINTASGFQVGSSDAIDSRLVLTKSEMLTVNENVYPEVYICVCKDDGLLYIFNKKNEIDNETGKFRVVTSNASIPEDLLDDLHTHDNKDVLDKITDNKVASWDAKATESFVTNAIANAQLGGGEGSNVDLSNYATKTDLENYAEKNHEHKEYLTEYQDLSAYALKTEIPDTTSFAKKDELHVHDNVSVLSKISESTTGTLLFNGEEIKGGSVNISVKDDNILVEEADGLYVSFNDAVIDPLEHVNEKQGIEDTPVGHIISHMGNTAPKHYLICDGTEYNIADYPYLTKHFTEQFGSVNYFGGDGSTTFAVPDLRGEFLRGTGTALRNTGSGAEVGAHQDGTNIQNPIATNSSNTFVYVPVPTTSQPINSIQLQPDTVKVNNNGGYFKIGDIITPQDANIITSYTSRPTNTSVLYCIKYEPTYFMQNFYTGNEETVLYEGRTNVECNKSLSNQNISISLADSIESYDEIRIYYGTYNSTGVNLSKCEMCKSNDLLKHTGGVFLDCNWTIVRMVLNCSFIDTHTFKITGSGVHFYTDNTNTTNLGIAIYRITGLKTSLDQDGSLPTGTFYTDEEVNAAIDNVLGGAE